MKTNLAVKDFVVISDMDITNKYSTAINKIQLKNNTNYIFQVI